jgi:hypothetical protein
MNIEIELNMGKGSVYLYGFFFSTFAEWFVENTAANWFE